MTKKRGKMQTSDTDMSEMARGTGNFSRLKARLNSQHGEAIDTKENSDAEGSIDQELVDLKLGPRVEGHFYRKKKSNVMKVNLKQRQIEEK